MLRDLYRLVGLYLVSGLLGSCGSSSSGLPASEEKLLPSTPEKGVLFSYYEPKVQAKWNRNWTYPLDLTGVSWNDSRTATLIDEQFVVMAAHYVRPSDLPVMFHDRNGKPVERYLVQVKSLAPMADVAVGKLNMPVPSSIKRYGFAPSQELRPGRAVLVTDQTKTVSVHQIQSVSGNMISFSYHPQLDAIYRRNLVAGDSGNPTFIISNNDLKLVETHFYGGPGSGPCYASGQIQSAIRAAIAEMR
jgi:hypothetical protein